METKMDIPKMSKNAMKHFLQERAAAFLAQSSVRGGKNNEILVSRKERRFAAKQIYKRLLSRALKGELNG